MTVLPLFLAAWECTKRYKRQCTVLGWCCPAVLCLRKSVCLCMPPIPLVGSDNHCLKRTGWRCSLDQPDSVVPVERTRIDWYSLKFFLSGRFTIVLSELLSSIGVEANGDFVTLETQVQRKLAFVHSCIIWDFDCLRSIRNSGWWVWNDLFLSLSHITRTLACERKRQPKSSLTGAKKSVQVVQQVVCTMPRVLTISGWGLCGVVYVSTVVRFLWSQHVHTVLIVVGLYMNPKLLQQGKDNAYFPCLR